MTTSVREFTAGSALYTRYARRTEKTIDDYRLRLEKATDRELLAFAYYAETLDGHGVADEIRNQVEHEIEWRRVTRDGFADWWIATIRGGTR